MKIILSSIYGSKSLAFKTRYNELIDILNIAKELKFDGIDYISTMQDIFQAPRKQLVISKKYAVPILSVHAPMHLLFYTPEFLFTNLLRMTGFFPDIQVFNFHLSGFIHHFHRNGKNIKTFFKYAQQKGVTVSFESNPRLVGLQYYPKVTYDPDQFATYCIAHDLPITFDTSHVAHCQYDIVLFFKKYYRNIRLIHLSDSRGSIQHLSLGKGNLPIKALLQEIKKKSYANLLCFEICKFQKGTTKKDKFEEIRNSLNMVIKYAL